MCIRDRDSIGKWVVDKENNGTPEHPIQMPFVDYSEMVHNFINDVYTFEESNKDMELTRYGDILKDNGLEWGTAVSYTHLDVYKRQGNESRQGFPWYACLRLELADLRYAGEPWEILSWYI